MVRVMQALSKMTEHFGEKQVFVRDTEVVTTVEAEVEDEEFGEGGEEVYPLASDGNIGENEAAGEAEALAGDAIIPRLVRGESMVHERLAQLEVRE
jgi:hypothetical protein